MHSNHKKIPRQIVVDIPRSVGKTTISFAYPTDATQVKFSPKKKRQRSERGKRRQGEDLIEVHGYRKSRHRGALLDALQTRNSKQEPLYRHRRPFWDEHKKDVRPETRSIYINLLAYEKFTPI